MFRGAANQHKAFSMKIQFLYWPECPSYEKGLERLKKVLLENNIASEIEIIEINSEEEAKRYNFIGSPTFLINGKDIVPVEMNNHAYGLTCRVYTLPDGRIMPLPSEEMIIDALMRVKDKE